MKAWNVFLLLFQQGVLLYFATINLLYAFFAWRGLRAVTIYTRELSALALKDLLERDAYKPVSILVPAYNEEGSIVASVRSFLGLQFPEFEVIVVSDGSTDDSVARMVAAFALVEDDRLVRRAIQHKPELRTFRSLRHPNLTVVEKQNGGKADALNCALNYARFPIVCAVDADSMLDVEALLRATRLFVQDESVVAVGGTIRLLNGARLSEGRVTELRLPSRWIERFQVLEYARAFFTGRAGWSAADALLIISGAFGLFRRDAVLTVGGYRPDTVGEDMELVMRLHRYFRERKLPYRVLSTPDPICWTEAPADMKTLRKQRNRWQRGLLEALWIHRVMFLNPRYGRLGMLAVPYFWLFEALSPVVEVFGYLFLLASFLLGNLFPEFALLFLLLAVLYGMLLSQLAAGIEMLLLSRYDRLWDRILLFLTGFVEFLGYRQLITWERFVATFQVRAKHGKWGAMNRQGIPLAGHGALAAPAPKKAPMAAPQPNAAPGKR
jgi:cellulose synthase/poly-beta-1,6-N-acetylglucosamine synthase-like glycosyltransferase